MAQIVIRGQEVYKCSVCNRSIRVDKNPRGLAVLNHCIITANCLGSLSKVTNIKESLSVPTIPPEVPNVVDWTQRKVLFDFNQTIESAEWIIPHNLNNRPVFVVYINNNGTLIPHTPIHTYTVSDKVSKLVFEKPYSGIAQAITLSSKTEFTKKSTIVSTTSQYTQASTNTGIIAIATLNSTASIQLQFEFTSITGTNNILATYIVDDIPSIDSPWSGSNKIYVDNKVYTVRTINIPFDSNNNFKFTNGTITNGSSFILKSINDESIKPGEILLLLAKSPYTAVDRQYDKLVYFDDIDNISHNNMVYDAETILIKNSTITPVYPYILVV